MLDNSRKGRKIKNSLTRASFLVPTLLFFGFAVIYPFLMGFNLAFTNWDGISPSELAKFVGFNNFINILKDTDVLRPLRISLEYAVLNTIGNNLLGLFFALGVTRIYKFNKFHRMIFFMPAALSSVLAVFMWNYIYANVFPSIFNWPNLIAKMGTVVPGVTLVTVWAGCGVTMLIYIAGLTSVPTVLYESATIDGANSFHKLKNVTLPMIMQSFTVNITITFTNSLSSAGLFLAATQGGPGGASESMGLYIYNYLFKYNKAGYGQALAYLFLIFVVVLGIIISRVFRKREVEL